MNMWQVLNKNVVNPTFNQYKYFAIYAAISQSQLIQFQQHPLFGHDVKSEFIHRIVAEEVTLAVPP